MGKKLKILMTNHHLAERAGTQLYIRDMAVELQRMGHSPFIYSPIVGEVAKEIRDATIPVVSDLSMLSIQPDIIHGHHHLETLSALLHFPETRGLFVCHGWFGWQEAPPKFPRILRYVAIDQLTYHRMILESGIPENNIRFLYNFADLSRFIPRSIPSKQPKKALVYSNYIEKHGNCFKMVQKACQTMGIDVEVVGINAGNPTTQPEKLLLNYDIVFAVGRSALEALATGAAVIIYSGYKIGPMVTSENFNQLQKTNFGLQALDTITTQDAIVKELKKYDPSDVQKLPLCVTKSAGKTEAAIALVELYEEILNDPYKSDPLEELKALGNNLHHFSKEFQAAIREVDHKRQKFKYMADLYHRLLKIPLIGKFFESLRNKFKK